MIHIVDSFEKTSSWKRIWNEDAIFSLTVESTPGTPVSIHAVIDGISNSNGKVAAKLAIEALYPAVATHIFPLLPGVSVAEDANAGVLLFQTLRSVILDVHHVLCDNVSRFGDLGCTLSLVVIAGNSVYTANVGDSPIFLRTGSGMKALYSPQNEGDDLSVLAKWCGPPRNTLDSQEDIPIRCFALNEDGILLLGTDGALSRNAISYEDLSSVSEEAMANNWPMEELVNSICALVDQGDSTDNLSVIAVRYCIS